MHQRCLTALLAALLAGGPCHAGTVLFDGSLGTVPSAQGWSFGSLGTATQTPAAGFTTLDSTPAPGDANQAGYARTDQSLDRIAGFAIDFTVRVASEAHASSHRAGFSIITLASDLRGAELGFWTSEIWAQADAPLFTHAEGNTTVNPSSALTPYRLVVQHDGYTLLAAGSAVLSGPLRDYSAHANPVYSTPNLLFLGDNTTSARAVTELSYIAVAPEPGSAIVMFGALLPICLRRRGARERPGTAFTIP